MKDIRNELIRLLSENARYSNADLASMLAVTPDEIAAAVRALEQEGVVRGYKALINREKAHDNRITALIEIQVTPQKDAGFEDIAERIMRFDEVESIYLMSGGFDFAVTVVGDSFEQVAMFVAKSLAPLEHVRATATHFVLRRYKEMNVELTGDRIDDRRVLSF